MRAKKITPPTQKRAPNEYCQGLRAQRCLWLHHTSSDSVTD
jgi:hypothetical protein